MKARIDALKRQVKVLDSTIVAGEIGMDEYQKRLNRILAMAGSWDRRQEVERAALLFVIHSRH